MATRPITNAPYSLPYPSLQIDLPDNSGNTPLHRACYSSSQGALYLLQAGVKIDTPNKNLTTPLHIACYARRKEVVLALLEKGAATDVKDTFGTTPFLLACQQLDAETLEAFKKKGANLDQLGDNAKNGIDEAVTCSNPSTLSFLLDNDLPIIAWEVGGKLLSPFHAVLGQENLVFIFLDNQRKRLAKVVELFSKEATEKGMDFILRTFTHQVWMHDAYAKSPYSEKFIEQTLLISSILSCPTLFNHMAALREIYTQKISQSTSVEELEKLQREKLEIIDLRLPRIRSLFSHIFQRPFLTTFWMKMTLFIASFNQLLHTCITKRASLLPKDPEAEFDESDVFALLATLGIGVGQTLGGVDITPLESFDILLGIQPEELYQLGIRTGSDLRILNITFTLRFLNEKGNLTEILTEMARLSRFYNDHIFPLNRQFPLEFSIPQKSLDFHKDYCIFSLRAYCQFLKAHNWPAFLQQSDLDSLTAVRQKWPDFPIGDRKGTKRKDP